MLGKAPPYLSLLVTITTSSRSKRSSRYISLVIPKANTSLATFPASSLLYLLFCTSAFLLAHHYLHIYHSSVHFLNCNYFATISYLLPYLLICRHCIQYILFSIVLLTVCLFIPCVTPCCCLYRTALLYLGQITVVNENLFSTGLPG
jgi:hypothetical protein